MMSIQPGIPDHYAAYRRHGSSREDNGARCFDHLLEVRCRVQVLIFDLCLPIYYTKGYSTVWKDSSLAGYYPTRSCRKAHHCLP